jgi:hypothetical protein
MMALEKISSVDLIEIVENRIVQVRTKTSILENGEQITTQFHRDIVVPNGDYSNQEPTVQAIANLIYTPEIVAAHAANLAASQLT